MNFLEAIQSKSLENVKEILGNLKEIPTLNFRKLDYEAVKTAVNFKRQDVLQLLLEKNYRVNDSTDTPLHTAAKLENIKLIKMLLEKGASINVINATGDTPLHIAFQNKQMEIVDLMLKTIEESSNYLNVENKQGLSHLDIVCTRANKAVAEGFLIVAKNAIEMIKQDLQSEKIEQESVEPTEEVTFPNDDNPTSSTAETITGNSTESSDSDNEEVTKEYDWFHELPAFESLFADRETAEFHIVCTERHPNVVKRYVREGWNVNAPLKDLDWNGWPEDSTPLHCAVEERNKENPKVRLELGADVMLEDENGATPLHVALYKDDPMDDGSTLDLLYEATRDKSVNLIEKNGLSFLHVAASRNDLETVRYYLDQGVNVNQKIGKDEYYGVSYFTPLHFAVRYRHQEMVELLIERGANVNSPSIQKPLHVACQYSHQGIIELLLKNGAQADVMTGKYSNKTPLHLLLEHIAEARWAKINAGDCKDEQEAFGKDFNRKLALFDSCFPQLITAGCDINAKDNSGNTALHYACATQLFIKISMKKLLCFGADINVENKKGKTPLEMKDKFDCYQNGDADDYMTLYHHVQKLKALGLQVNPKNEVYCKKIMSKRTEWSKQEEWDCQPFSDDELAKRNKQRLDEIAKMKRVMLTEKHSLYDFVRTERIDPRFTLTNAKLREILKNTDAYPEYSWRIWLPWREAEQLIKTKVASKRKNTSKETKNSFICKRLNV